MGQGYIAQYGNDPTNGQHYWVKGENKMFEYDYHTTFYRDFSTPYISETTTHELNGNTLTIKNYQNGNEVCLIVTLNGNTIINSQSSNETLYFDYITTNWWADFHYLVCLDFNNNRVYFVQFDNEFLYYYDTPEILTSTNPNEYQENIVPPSRLSGDYIKKIF